MNKLTIKKFHILNKIFSISEIGVFVLFFLLPYVAVASPITKELILKLTNHERASQNLLTLEQNPVLEQVALNKARDIMDKQYFAHTNPEGKPFYEWVDESGYNYSYAGENLAIDFDEAEDVMNAWMASPKHRENIVNENYSEIGIAVLDGTYEGHYSTVIVQIFGQPFMIATKLNKFNSLEEQTFTTLVKGEAENKAITEVPMKNENGFMLNTPLTIGDANESQTYELAKEQLVMNQLTETVETTETKTESNDKNRGIKLSLNQEITSNKVINYPGFDILMLITVCIIILSVYGSIIEKIKNSFKCRHYSQQ